MMRQQNPEEACICTSKLQISPELESTTTTQLARCLAVSKSGTGTRVQGKWGRGDSGTWGRGVVGTLERGDVRMWGLGDSGKWRRVFTICLTFRHISQNSRRLIVTALYPGFKFLVCTM